MAAGFFLTAYYLLHSLFRGKAAPMNPWGGNSLEWHTASPPPARQLHDDARSPRIRTTTANIVEDRAHRRASRSKTYEGASGMTPRASMPHLQHHFDTAEQQFDAGKLGMWLFLATEILLFGGLFCAYAVYRANHPEIFLYAHQFLDKSLGGTNTVILLCSSLTMAWAVRASQLGQRKLLIGLLVADAPRRLRLHGDQVRRVQGEVGARPSSRHALRPARGRGDARGDARRPGGRTLSRRSSPRRKGRRGP